MKQPARITLASLAVALAVGLLCRPSSGHGQAANDDQAIAALATEIADQQTKIAANQKLVDDKLAAIAEEIRLARIFVSRAGGRSK